MTHPRIEPEYIQWVYGTRPVMPISCFVDSDGVKRVRVLDLSIDCKRVISLSSWNIDVVKKRKIEE